ncbi:NnrS family protein [Candidatus Parabeggiatoa sp. HSG14]|uniref:NnrS family protein n=1 Tax=Candidatus Parabeggiatoa sp. HSG14 TaxID=3055593 RepID=UPI0025A80D99|nr:NnrS family protein [Thiotrichales bacterium HSG14]
MANILLNIEPQKNVGKFAFLHLGFRPFFVGASSFAFLAMLVWMGIYTFEWFTPFSHFSPMTWHAHEMIFGYSIAVVAGFLLTAVKNWTRIQTLHGYPLLFLFLLWLVARLLPFFGDIVPLSIIATIDNLFILLLSLFIFLPLLKVRDKKSIALASLLLLLLISNIVFYCGLYGLLSNGIYYGLYAGLYLILSFIFVMGRRVIPFFIEKGVGYPIQVKNWQWVDKSHLIVFWAFAIVDLVNFNPYLTATFAGLSFLIHGLRLVGWFTRGLWKKPLLWILYVGYAFIVIGFMLKVLVVISGLSVYLAVHAFAFGGIGMITIGMMARVSLGHTGRNIFNPPRSLFWIFALLLCGSVVRVIFPLIDNSFYLLWIAFSQFFWIFAFGWFFYIYFPILIYPRTDGHYG